MLPCVTATVAARGCACASQCSLCTQLGRIALLVAALAVAGLFVLWGPAAVLAQETMQEAPQQVAALPGKAEAGDETRLAEMVRASVRLVQSGAYEKAIQLLEPYRDADHFTLLHALGIAYVRVNRNPEAYAVLLRAHALRPTVAAPLLPAALACVKMARTCDNYRELALEYKQLGGRLVRFADKIANHLPFTLTVRNF